MVAAWYIAGDFQFAEFRESLWIFTLVLMAVLAVTAITIIWVGRWIKRPSSQAGDDLAYYRLLYEQGEFSREEYERIRAKLGQRLRKELDLPPPGDGQPPSPPNPETQGDTNIRVGQPLPPVPPPPQPPPT